MPDQTDNRIRWDTIPILGNNPVFCFEARRLWTRRTIGVLLLVALGTGLVGWGLHRGLRQVFMAKGAGVEFRLFMEFGGALPPVLPLDAVLEWRARERDPSLRSVVSWVFAVLRFLLIAAAKFLMPALAALSIATDRSSWRLGPLLASRTSVDQILLGKLMALTAPLCLLALALAVARVPLVLSWDFSPVPDLLWHLELMALLLLWTAFGLDVGASIRQPSLAVGVTVVVTGIFLPVATSVTVKEIIHIAWPSIHESRLDVTNENIVAVSLVWTGVLLLFCGTLFAVTWLSARRALARAAE